MNLARPFPATATAPLPDLSVLKDLSPGVAYATLAAIVIVTLLLYLGPGLRARMTRTEPPKPDPPAAAAPTAALPQALDRADHVSSQFIDHLLRRDEEAVERTSQLERENATLRDEVSRLNRLLSQRGSL